MATGQAAVTVQSTNASQWQQRAETAQQSLVEHFWDAQRGLFVLRHPAIPDEKVFHYWWQAHAIDALVDGFVRTGKRSYLDRANKLWAGVKQANHGVTNSYYDDMLWMALALQRLHQATNDATQLADIRTLWRDVQTGWNEQQGGGIAWRKSQLDYKNTPANAPAVILAARLYRAHGDRDDLAFAKRIYAWLDQNLVDPTSGFVWDGKNRKGDGRIDKDWAFTYNQGVRIGAAVELYRTTKQPRYLQEARQTLRATRSRLIDKRGLLTERGKGDGALFKGILVRYLGELAAVDASSRNQIAEILRTQADAVWNQATTQQTTELQLPLFAADWSKPAKQPVELSAQLSALMLLEQMAQQSAAVAKPPKRSGR